MAGSTDEDDAARAVGLEVTCERYVQTLVRVRRVRRAAWLAARLGPLAGAVPGADRRAVGVSAGDAREVLGKLWTAGERYRRLRESLDGSGDRVDPGGGYSAAAFADLRRRLIAVPDRAQTDDYAAVAATMADADRAIRDLREARADDCAALSEFDPERLRNAAETAAGEMNAAYEARRAARTSTETEETTDRAEEDETETETPERTAGEADDGPDGAATATGDGAASNADGPESDAGADADERERAAASADAGDEGIDADAADPETVIGSSFDIDVSADESVGTGAAGGEDDRSTDDADEQAAESDEAEETEANGTDDSAFQFGVVAEAPDDEKQG